MSALFSRFDMNALVIGLEFDNIADRNSSVLCLCLNCGTFFICITFSHNGDSFVEKEKESEDITLHVFVMVSVCKR